jgi:hypothetical protein
MLLIDFAAECTHRRKILQQKAIAYLFLSPMLELNADSFFNDRKMKSTDFTPY